MPRAIFMVLFVWAAPAQAAEFDPHIRTLAASCAACHGTNGVSQGGTPSLAGLDESYFVRRMLEYRAEEKSTAVMPQHARGLTHFEITELAKYFSDQLRACPYFQKHSLKTPLNTLQGE